MITAVLSDIHGRLDAFLTVLEDPAFGSADRVFFLGDLSGYGPEPEKCGRLWLTVRERIPTLSVAGNHELLVSGRLSANGFSRSAADSHAAEDSGLSDKVRKAFADLPLTATADDAFVCHGSPTDTCEYLDSPASVRNALETTGGYGWLFAGHTHVPAVWDGHRLLRPRKEEESFRFEGSGPFFLNPGSVGQPRDGRTGASYCLWNDTARTALFRCVPVDKIRNRKKARKNDE